MLIIYATCTKVGHHGFEVSNGSSDLSILSSIPNIMQELVSSIVGLTMVRNRSFGLILFPGDEGSRQKNVCACPISLAIS